MTAIKKILTTGQSAREDAPMPSDQDFRTAEVELGFRFPASYREFVRLGGLGELRINHRVLPPAEILQSRRYLPDQEHVPFADNGCGDLYCWPRVDAAEPSIVFAHHESGSYVEDAASFSQWLEENRF